MVKLSRLKLYLKLFRVNSYVKNLFVFAPLFFSFQFDGHIILSAFIVFILFSLLASSVYIFNDIFDLESDKKHPVKKNRPLASGSISVKKGKVIAALLMIISLLTIIIVGHSLFYVFLSYLIINVFYNLHLKKVPVVDILIISFGFIIRILAGSYATNIPASYWILIMTFLLSMFLGFSKRRADIVLAKENGNGANNIKIFSLTSINRILIVFTVLICSTYFAYTISDEVVVRIGSEYVFLTNVFVILGILRYIQIIIKNKQYEDPTAIVVGDWKLQIIIFLWGLTFILLKYI